MGTTYVDVGATELSSVRMKKGEPFVAINFTGPKGGYSGMSCLSLPEALKLASALIDAVTQAEARDG